MHTQSSTAIHARIPKRSQKGQAGLVVLLMTVVLLTIGIAVAARTTGEVKISRQEEESNRVFNAAEAGAEAALGQGLDFQGNVFSDSLTIDDADVSFTIEKENVLDTRLFEGVSAQVNVTGVSNGQGLQLLWSKESGCGSEPASLLITIFSNEGGTVRSRSQGIAACDHSDGFSLISGGGINGFLRGTTINLQSNDLFVRIKPLYNDTYVQVTGSGWNLPTQFYRVRSVAESNLGDEVRAIQVNRSLSAAPSIFDYVLFSGGTISK